MATKLDNPVEHARRIFNLAVGYQRAMGWAAGPLTMENPLIATIISAVNGALAEELFLKSLATLDNGVTPFGHDLLELFEELKPETQQEMETLYEQLASKDPHMQQVDRDLGYKLTCRRALELSKNAFVLFRYAYEDKFSPEDGYLLRVAIPTTGETIIKRHPEFFGGKATLLDSVSGT